MLTRGGEEVKSREMMRGGKGVEQQCQRSV